MLPLSVREECLTGLRPYRHSLIDRIGLDNRIGRCLLVGYRILEELEV